MLYSLAALDIVSVAHPVYDVASTVADVADAAAEVTDDTAFAAGDVVTVVVVDGVVLDVVPKADVSASRLFL